MVSSFVFSNRRSKKRHMAGCPDLDQIRIFQQKKRTETFMCTEHVGLSNEHLQFNAFVRYLKEQIDEVLRQVS